MPRRNIYIYFIFRASKIVLCNFSVFNSHMKGEANFSPEKKRVYINIEGPEGSFNCLSEVNQEEKNEFIDCHTWLQTCNQHVQRFASPLHSQRVEMA